ncbi:MAG: hypothetical protein LBQ54_05900 [Planctomycetaceae bacterium]|jgi:hypothetical protein|nr:hypothetical protein [Planctomycetaceae bacterium]
MSTGNIGYTLASAAAGSQMAEKQAESPEKLAHADTNAQRTRDSVQRAEKAEAAAFVREESAETADRDADGRQVWQRTKRKSNQNSSLREEKSKDFTGQVGNLLDIDG